MLDGPRRARRAGGEASSNVDAFIVGAGFGLHGEGIVHGRWSGPSRATGRRRNQELRALLRSVQEP